MGHVSEKECKKAKCEYLAKMVRGDNTYYCTDCQSAVYNIEGCGIIDDMYEEQDKRKAKGWDQ